MKHKFPKITWQHFKNLSKKQKLKEYFHEIFSVSKDPRNFAFSVAIGIFIGLFFPMGLQTIFLLPISILLGCNLFIAWLFTFISNPITIIPIYFFVFRIGELVTSLEISQIKIEILLNEMTLKSIFDLGKEGLLIFFSGAFVTALFSAFLAFIISFQLMKLYLKKYN